MTLRCISLGPRLDTWTRGPPFPLPWESENCRAKTVSTPQLHAFPLGNRGKSVMFNSHVQKRCLSSAVPLNQDNRLSKRLVLQRTFPAIQLSGLASLNCTDGGEYKWVNYIKLFFHFVSLSFSWNARYLYLFLKHCCISINILLQHVMWSLVIQGMNWLKLFTTCISKGWSFVTLQGTVG